MAEAAQKPQQKKEWFEVVEEITPYMIRVVTPDGFGTGFFLVKSTNGQLCGVATAYHVIARAFEWGFPIRLEHVSSKKVLLLHPDNRHIEYDVANDTAVIVFMSGELPLPRGDLELIAEKKFLKVGCDVGWVGFPTISPDELCFFSGHVSNRNSHSHRYFIDGVAINGVSGGPVLRPRNDGKVHLIGIITAYVPNVSTGDSMPGLSVVQDVPSFFPVIKKLKSLPPPETNPPPSSPSAPLVEPKLPQETPK
jgi:hypothetical protein